MLKIVPNTKAEPSALRRRRQEIEYSLAAHDLRRRGANHEDGYSRRLRQALEGLGPVFSAFGLYLASRADLFPLRDCLELDAISERVETMPIAAVEAVVAREMGCPIEAVYSMFDTEPFESQLIYQSHHAVLNNGHAVTVKVVHPALQEHYANDLELLPILQNVLRHKSLPGPLIEDAIADFCYTWHQRLNLLHEVKVFEALAYDVRDFAMLWVPAVHRDFCAPHVMTHERVSGLNLGELFALAKTSSGATATRVGLDEEEIAHRLCLVWLRQALLGSQFPTEARPEDIAVLPGKQIAFTSGTCISLPLETKKNLLNYLIAVSNANPDEACTWLLRDIRATGGSVNENALRYRFREIIPFRDSEWEHHAGSPSIAEYLLVHWRLVREHGLRPPSYVTGFYRGLFRIVAAVQRFSPHSDPLLHALQDVRTLDMLAHLQEMMMPRHMSDSLDKYVTLMMRLPKQLDAALMLSNAHQTRRSGVSGQCGQQSYALAIMLFLLLVSIVLLAHHLSISAVANLWVDRISTALLVLVGIFLLRIVCRV